MSWDDVTYVAEPLEAAPVAALVTAFEQIYVNGGVVLRSFQAQDPAAFDHARRMDRRGIQGIARTFLTRPTVVCALPELQIRAPLETPPEFRLLSPFGMEGQLTHLLLTGGAYERFRGGVEAARVLSRGFTEALLDLERDRETWAADSWTPWTSWFFDIAWDATFVIHDPRKTRFVLLCLTDTD